MGKKGDSGRKKEARQAAKASAGLGLNLTGLGAGAVCLALALLAGWWMRPQPEINYDDGGFLPELPPQLLPEGCPKAPRNDSSEIVSIIIPYYKEEWFRIEITMRSIIRNTNLDLLKEIIWVSDGNGPEGIFDQQLRSLHPKVQVFVNQENKGLIFTKMASAKRARGSVLMFLEPHVVVAPGWLEPLLSRLAEEPKALVMPVIDVLTEDLRQYNRIPFTYWRFEWNLNLIATNPWQKDRTDISTPYPSPGTSGGIYAIRKDWWDHLEFFDPELIRWGGDHVEASHKVWRCGGRIELHPCARVGHWFRTEQDRPYEVPVPDVVKNYKRLAEVWLDDHKPSFYKVKPEAKSMQQGDLTAMQEVRSRLQCEDMDWYLKYVDVELAWEEKHICIPGAPKSLGGCDSSQAAPMRSTLDKVMPLADFKKARKALPERFRHPKLN